MAGDAGTGRQRGVGRACGKWNGSRGGWFAGAWHLFVEPQRLPDRDRDRALVPAARHQIIQDEIGSEAPDSGSRETACETFEAPTHSEQPGRVPREAVAALAGVDGGIAERPA